MAKSNENMTFKGSPMTVTGNQLSEGDMLPQFVLTGTEMQEITNAEFSGKVLIVSVAPSLDTPVCQLQTKRFNQEASKMSDQIAVLTVSRDLPFAQKRWCGAEGVEQVVCASDYKHRTFGQAFGVDAEDIGLLCRAVFVADKDGKLTYVDYVTELSEEPNYQEVLDSVAHLCG